VAALGFLNGKRGLWIAMRRLGGILEKGKRFLPGRFSAPPFNGCVFPAGDLSAMNFRLVIEKGPTKTRTIRIRIQETVIGRQHGCDLRIPSKTVSRRHCLLSFQDGYLTAEDLDSANGTLLNGELINGKEVVRPGDRLEIGPLVFVVEYQLTQQAIELLAANEEAELEELEEVFAEDDDVTEFAECVPELDAEDDTEKAKVEPGDPTPAELEVPAEAGNESVVVLDDSEPFRLPDDGELRDILSKLDG
jgi:pSer/pThr/pTyr-binding forkhead associated (FHA) protein